MFPSAHKLIADSFGSIPKHVLSEPVRVRGNQVILTLESVLDIHTGFSWVPPGKSKYALPIHLDDVAGDFPELKIVAFHMGYPHCDDLNMVALGHPNVYPCLSLLVPWAISAPRKFARIIGENLAGLLGIEPKRRIGAR